MKIAQSPSVTVIPHDRVGTFPDLSHAVSLDGQFTTEGRDQKVKGQGRRIARKVNLDEVFLIRVGNAGFQRELGCNQECIMF